jgi:hypothetical protein
MGFFMSTDWIPSAVDAIKRERVEHQTYKRVRGDLFEAIVAAEPGEVIVLVGPTRAGKSKVLKDALRTAFGSRKAGSKVCPAIIVEAENAGPDGEFSTKDFMREALKQIEHPIYGIASDDDIGEAKLDALINKTPERTLRAAFQNYLTLRRTRVFAIDEAQHVAYVRGKSAGAARVLNSWKCLANKTKVVLVLVGSYELLQLVPLAPHMAGRQGTIEFPRYRVVEKADVIAFEEVLKFFSQFLCFSSNSISLRSFNKLLFTGSLGCVGTLSSWLRRALAHAQSRGISIVTKKLLQAVQKPKLLLDSMEREILIGERSMRLDKGEKEPTHGRKVRAPKKTKGKPFQAKNTRHARGGRS